MHAFDGAIWVCAAANETPKATLAISPGGFIPILLQFHRKVIGGRLFRKEKERMEARKKEGGKSKWFRTEKGEKPSSP